MTDYESKLRRAYELGKIAGAAEGIEDMGPRDCIYGAAHTLFDGLLTEAAEEAQRLVRITRDYPPDPFDFVETEEMVEKETEPKKQTNFARLTKSPEVLARNLAENVYECPRGGCPYDDRHDPSKEDCVRCLTDWLNEEATPDD